jgi:hypothetical protein
MRLPLGLTIGLLACLPAHAQKTQDLLALEGRWAGSYTCSGTGIPVDLTIAQNIAYPDGMSATFRFGGIPGDSSRVAGEFWMKVTRLGFNDFRF